MYIDTISFSFNFKTGKYLLNFKTNLLLNMNFHKHVRK